MFRSPAGGAWRPTDAVRLALLKDRSAAVAVCRAADRIDAQGHQAVASHGDWGARMSPIRVAEAVGADTGSQRHTDDRLFLARSISLPIGPRFEL